MFISTEELYTVEAIKRIEKAVVDRRLQSERMLMEKAGAAAFNALLVEWPEARRLAVFCGRGNNGGDGFVLARIAYEQGMQVTVYLADDMTATKGVARETLCACQDAGVRMTPLTAANQIEADVVVDALIGTGLKRHPEGIFQSAISTLNNLNIPILSLDIPSGLNADSGDIYGVAVNADLTVTFIALKQGLFTHYGPACTGKVLCDDLGVPKALLNDIQPNAELLSWKKVKHWLPRRHRDAHKGDFGHVLVIGGDYGMGGSIRMASEAALRVGAGLVTVATRPEHVSIVISSRPEIMCREVNQGEDLKPLLEIVTVVVIGPGLGKGEWGQSLLSAVLATDLPMVLDADSLNLLAQQENRPHFSSAILTPHPGEAARLLKTTNVKIQENRFEAVSQIQAQFGGVIVLKGAGTLIKSDSPVPAVCRAGNPGMASGGMGDVLSGVIGGLLAQGLDVFAAAEVGVFVHALAADRAAQEGGERGLLATDLMDHLRRLVNPIARD